MFYLIALQGLNYIAPVLVLPYLMVVLGAEKFGFIGFSLSVCQYLMLIVDFGFNLSGTKKIALIKSDPKALNETFSAIVYAKLILLLISFLLLLGISLIPAYAVYRTTMLVMFSVVLGNTFLFVFLFQGLSQIKWVSILNAIAKCAILPLTFVLVKSADDYLIAALLQGGVSIFAAIMSLILLAKKRWVSLIRVNVKRSMEEIKDSFPLFLSSAATSIYVALFVVILGYFASPEEVGRYSAVDRVMRALTYLCLVPVLQAFYPKISALGLQNRTEAIEMVKKIQYFIIFAMSAIALAMFFGGGLVQLLLGGNYQGTETLFKIMALAPVFIGVGGVMGQLKLLALGNKQDKKHFTITYYIAAVVAIGSVFVLSYYYHADGAAISLVLTEAVVFVLMCVFSRKMS